MSALIAVTFWHEGGHLLSAWLVHIPVRRITIGLGPALWRRKFGSNTEIVLRAAPLGMSIGVPGRRRDDGSLRRPIRHDLLMAISGPAASLLLTGAIFMLAFIIPGSSPSERWFIVAALLSALLGLLNLLPIPGLDGGHILVLSLARLGRQLSPRGEIRLHRMGLHLTAMAALLLMMVVIWVV